jgi:hypothetical protein
MPILALLAHENKLAGVPDFDDAAWLGSAQLMVDRLSDLIVIF